MDNFDKFAAEIQELESMADKEKRKETKRKLMVRHKRPRQESFKNKRKH